MKLETRTLLGGSLSIVALVAAILLLGRAVTTPTVDRRVEERLDDAHAVHAQLLRDRLDSLVLLAELVSRDSFITAQLEALRTEGAVASAAGRAAAPVERSVGPDGTDSAEEAPAIDVGALGDLLDQRREESGLDAILLVDREGRLLASSGDPLGPDQIGLLTAAGERSAASGLLGEEGRLYAAAVRTLEHEFEAYGSLLVARALDDRFARQIASTLPDQLAFLSFGAAGTGVAGSSLPGELATALPTELRKLGPVEVVLIDGLGRDLELEGDRWRVLPVPLRDPGDQPIGVALAMVSRSELAAPLRRLAMIVSISGLATLLLFALATRWAAGGLRSDLELVEQSLAAARRGDLSTRIAASAGGNFAEIGRDLDTVLSAVQEERALSQLVERASRSLPEPAATPVEERPAFAERVLVLLENRAVSGPRSGAEPERTMRRLTRDLQTARSAVARRGGRIDGLIGHRLLLSFDESAAQIAVGLAARLVNEVSTPESAFDEVEPGCAAVTLGRVVTGTVPLRGAPEPVALGTVLRRLDSLVREAGEGEVVLSRELYTRVESALAHAAVPVREQRGLLVPQPLYVVDGERAQAIDGASEGLREPESSEPADALSLGDVGPGTVLGERFEVHELLGEGRAGPLFKAFDRELADWVALRLLLGGEAHRDALQPAIQAVGRTRHPGVSRITDSGTTQGVSWVARRFVRGLSLAAILEKCGRLGPTEVRALAQRACGSLAALHEAGQVHGALTAHDLLLSSAGGFELSDAGMASLHAAFDDPRRAALSPEQRSGARGDERSDIWALGVVLYRALLGRAPFDNLEGDVATAPSLVWSGVPSELERALDSCLDPSPNKRFASVGQLWEAWSSVELRG